MLPPFIRNYVVQSIGGTPAIIRELLGDLPAESPAWNFRPDPERFTLREILAHLNDFDSFWLTATARMVNENHPNLPPRGDDYLNACAVLQNPLENLTELERLRPQLAEWFTALPEDQFSRGATRARIGEFTVEDAAVLIVAHDKYHLQQIVEWLQSLRSQA